MVLKETMPAVQPKAKMKPACGWKKKKVSVSFLFLILNS